MDNVNSADNANNATFLPAVPRRRTSRVVGAVGAADIVQAVDIVHAVGAVDIVHALDIVHSVHTLDVAIAIVMVIAIDKG